jgi:hypothetical protein
MSEEQLSKEEAFELLKEIRDEHEKNDDTDVDDQDEP